MVPVVPAIALTSHAGITVRRQPNQHTLTAPIASWYYWHDIKTLNKSAEKKKKTTKISENS